MSKFYGLYDAKYYEQLITIGTTKEIAKFLGITASTLRSMLSHKRKRDKKYLVRNRYEIVEIIK